MVSLSMKRFLTIFVLACSLFFLFQGIQADNEVIEEIEEVVVVEKVAVEVPDSEEEVLEEQQEQEQQEQQPEKENEEEDHGPPLVDRLIEQGKQYLHEGSEIAHEILRIPQRVLERKDKFENLWHAVKQQNPVLLLVIALIPFLSYLILLPEKYPVVNFSEKISTEEWDAQTKDYTAQQLAQLESFIKENPTVVETTKYYKEIYTATTTPTTTTIEAK